MASKFNKCRTAIAILMFASPASSQPPPTKVVLEKARTVDAPATITLVGTVVPARSSRVASELSGVVAKMQVREGDLVEQGQPLCSLNVDSLTLQLAAELARLQSLKSRHEELLAGTRPEEIARAKALHEESIAERDRWRFELDRVAKLYSGSESNAKEISDTRASFLAAEQRMLAAQAEYDQAKSGPRKETIAQAAHEVAQHQAVVDRLQSDLRKADIRAPFAGHVVSRAVEIGEWVAAGGTVATMIELSTVLVWVDAPESVLPFLVVGEGARVKIDALGRSFDGIIKHVMREADRTARTFPFEIEIKNTDGILAAGMFARATVSAGPKRAALAVPKDAVVTNAGVDRVGVVTQGPQGAMATLVSVTTGMSVGDWITITSEGIKEGDAVVIRGTENLMPFPSPVLIVDAQGTPVANAGAPAAPAGAASSRD
jgi:RND family efflux transporter MFP subunit